LLGGFFYLEAKPVETETTIEQHKAWVIKRAADKNKNLVTQTTNRCEKQCQALIDDSTHAAIHEIVARRLEDIIGTREATVIADNIALDIMFHLRDVSTDVTSAVNTSLKSLSNHFPAQLSIAINDIANAMIAKNNATEEAK